MWVSFTVAENQSACSHCSVPAERSFADAQDDRKTARLCASVMLNAVKHLAV